MTKLIQRAALACAITLLIKPTLAHAHGFEGDRFFPPTISTDDPFATDEFSLTVSSFNNPADDDGPKTRELDVSTEFDKEIFPKFALGISGTYINLEPTKHGNYLDDDGNPTAPPPSQDGFDNLSISAKYQLFENAPHEFILSLGGEADLGGTGSKALGVESYTTYTPTLYYGKGFGDLPNALKYLKPFALTGTLGYEIPSKSSDPNVLDWGFALEYSLPYLQQHVEDIGLPKPLSDFIPLVEFNMTSPTNRSGETTTGTINPGILWEQPDFQLGAEAVIPVNAHTGPDVGFVVQVQFFIDDLFPKVFGHPIFFNDNKSGDDK
jgi:hypothetical protein